MKKLSILILLIGLTFSVKAAKYYFSSSTGNDLRTSAESQNPLTPWKTLAKLNTYFSSLLPGDSVLFKRNEIFYGFLTISRSGTLSLPIIIGAYGTGARPILKGTVPIGGFTQTSTNIWTSAANSSLTTISNIVLDDGVQIAIGRYPNLNTTNKGWLMYESSTISSVTDLQLSTTPTNWTGAGIVIRSDNTHIKTATITSHVNTTLNFSPNKSPTAHSGYFIFNDRRTLDINGEYYYNSSAKTFDIFSNAGAPTNIEASNITTIIKSVNFSYIHFTDLQVVGANTYGISIGEGTSTGGGGTGIVIKNCNINYCGVKGIFMNNHTSGVIKDNSIDHSMDDGIYINNSTGSIIRKNKIDHSYEIAGQGGEGFNGGGIYAPVCHNLTVDSNLVKNSGCFGIRGDGDNTVFRNNVIDGYCLLKNDAGGIVMAVPNGGIIERTGEQIVGNVILNAGDASAGSSLPTNPLAFAIYTDVSNSNCLIQGNTLANGNVGMYLHRGNDNIVRNNTIYNFATQFQIFSDISNADAATHGSTTELVRGLIFKNNILFSLTSTQRIMNLYATNSDVRLWGTFDSNYYCRPLLEPNNINNAGTSSTGGITSTNNSGVNSWYSLLGGWNVTYSPKDINSKKSPKNDIVRFEPNTSYRDSVINLNYGSSNYKWYTAQGALIQGTYTMPPYSSIILIRDALVSTAPNIKPTVSLTIPSNGATYTSPASVSIAATASDADGTVSIVRFYSGSTYIGSDASSPYTFNWTGVGPGGYSITAHAIDNSGDSTISAAINITVSAPPPANVPPTVSITAPANGATYTSPATIIITASASDQDGTVTQVQFYNGATLLNTDASSPYTYTWSGVTSGTYNITAKATDNSGGTTTSGSVQVTVQTAPPANVSPTVSLVSPANGTTYGEPATVYLSATASDANGTVSQVQFYSGSTLLATDVDSPYVYTWSNVAAGSYNLTAKATDNLGATKTSSIAGIIVVANIPPTVSITSPADSANYTTPADITIEATAVDADGSVTVVNFYQGLTWIGSSSVAPYTFDVLGLATGTYTFRATATDNSGDSTSSATKVVTVSQPISAALAINVSSSAILCVNGTSTIIVGATGGTEPYTGTGTSVVSAGTYTYIIVDNLGARDTAVVTVTQPAAIVVTNSPGTITSNGGTTSLSVSSTGGTGTYQYKLDNGFWQSSNTFTGVGAGTHISYVKDSNGCPGQAQFSITQPASPGNSQSNKKKHYNQ